MKQGTLARLKALERRHPGTAFAIVEQDKDGWKAVWNGRERDFDTLDAARDFLEDRADIVIIDDF